MKKIAIYTSIVGNIDSLMEPHIIHDQCDYICFVEKGKTVNYKKGVWQFREIPYANKDNRVLSRFVKINPHLVLAEYDYSLWIDGNVTISDYKFYEILWDKIDKEIDYSGVCHWGRDCSYEEAYAILNANKDSVKRIVRSLLFLKRNNFPKHYGMYENNVIFRKHNKQNIIEFDTLWWYLYLKYSHRDQVLHSYCLYKMGICFDYLLPPEYCARNHYSLYYKKHENNDCSINYSNLLIRKFKVWFSKIILGFLN